jgi:chorismate dehydratase
LVCDALEAVKKIKLKFDIIFLDPFSPKKNPELWTETFFKELRRLINKDGILTTYSCAGIVRRNLKSAGFTVKDGPCVGRRSPSIIALPL